jgi:two-component system LytT family response regulator
MSPDRIRTLIVDDEPLARSLLAKFLASDPEIEIIGECGDGCTAVERIESSTPDLVFLDVQMPELDGFGVLQAIEPVKLPNIVFVTAHDQFALKAFEVHAIDYLLKPFDRERFQHALARAKRQIALQKRALVNEELVRLLAERSERMCHPTRLLVKTDGRVFFVQTAEVLWIEAQGNYAALHVAERSYLMRQTMTSFEKQLDPEKFQRIQRSAIVNLDTIRELQPLTRGEYHVLLKNGTKLKLNRRYRKSFSRFAAGTL